MYSAPTNSNAPDLAYDSASGEYLVVWRESTGGSTEDVYARRVRSDGVVLGNAVSLGAQTADPFGPSVAYHPGANDFLVVWTDGRSGNWDAYGRLVDADGTPMGSAFALEATSANQTDVTVARQGYGWDLYLAYSDDGSGNPDLYGERYIPPMASFNATPQIGSAPLTVAFTDTSIAPNGVTGWAWNLGDGVTSTLQNLTHTYTLFGSYSPNLTAQSNEQADRSGGASIVVLNPPPPTTNVIAYSYDGLYRLTRATHSSGEVFEYQYDTVGNRLAYTRTLSASMMTTYTYDAANRLTSVNGQAYTWDANGNLLNDGEKSYTYDQANRLTGITASGLTWNATYNGDGARLKQSSNGSVTTYTLDLAAPLVQVLVQQEAANTTTYLYGVTRIGEQQSGGWAYHLSDALGSVRQLADGSAQVVLARGYMPYGEMLWSLGDGSSTYGYTGEDWDTTTQLVFLRARYMQPGLGIFLSHDPWDGDELQPLTYNGWTYVEGNPMNSTDPTGDCAGCAVGSLALVARANQAGQGGLAFRSHPDQRAPTIPPHRLPDGSQVRLLSNVVQGRDGLAWRWISLFTMPTRTGFVADSYLVPVSGPPSPPGGGTSPSLNFGFSFTQWPVSNPSWYNAFGPNLFAYCTAGLEGESKEEKRKAGCPDAYLEFSNEYKNLHGLHNGVDFGVGNGTPVKWTATVVGRIIDSNAVIDTNTRMIVEAGNYRVVFGHTRLDSQCVSIGSTVTSGTVIGKIAEQDHLHLSIVPRNKPYYFTNPASAFMPSSDTLGAEYPSGHGSMKAFDASYQTGNYWDGTFKDYE